MNWRLASNAIEPPIKAIVNTKNYEATRYAKKLYKLPLKLSEIQKLSPQR